MSDFVVLWRSDEAISKFPSLETTDGERAKERNVPSLLRACSGPLRCVISPLRSNIVASRAIETN